MALTTPARALNSAKSGIGPGAYPHHIWTLREPMFKFLAAALEPVSVGPSEPARDEARQPRVHHSVGVAGVVHGVVTMPDPGGRCGARHAHRIRARTPLSAVQWLRAGGSPLPSWRPSRVPGDAKLVGLAETEVSKRYSRTCRGPWPTATTLQSGQPARSSPVST